MIKDNKSGFVSIDLKEQKVPVYKEVWNSNNNWYMAGDGNKWFEELQELYYNSSVHGAILNNLHNKILRGSEDELFSRVALDYAVYGGFAIEVIWNIDHTKIVKANYLDYAKIRSGKPDDQNNVQFYYYSNDWTKYSNRDIKMIQAYNDNPLFDDHQIFCHKRYMLGDDIYSKPSYIAGISWVVTDIQLQNYYSNLVKNNFVANKLLSINSYFDEDKQVEFEAGLKKNFTNTDNAGKMLIFYSEDKDHAPTIDSFNNEEDDLKYRFITEQITSNIAVSHNLPVQLLGILVPGKLGSATEIPVFDAIYERTTVAPMRRDIVKALTPLYEKFLSITQLPGGGVEQVTPEPLGDTSNPR